MLNFTHAHFKKVARISAHLIGKNLPTFCLAFISGNLPLHTHVFVLHDRSHTGLGANQRNISRLETHI
jgi:hypothetical protein